MGVLLQFSLMVCSMSVITYEDSGRSCQAHTCEGVSELARGGMGIWREFLPNLTVFLQVHSPNAPHANCSLELAWS